MEKEMSDQSTALQAIFNRTEAGRRLSQKDLQMLIAEVRSPVDLLHPGFLTTHAERLLEGTLT